MGLDATTQTPRTVRIRVETVGGAIVVTDLDGNLFERGTMITVTPQAPDTLVFAITSGGVSETLQIRLAANGDLTGTYAITTLAFPPVGSTTLFTLSKQS